MKFNEAILSAEKTEQDSLPLALGDNPDHGLCPKLANHARPALAGGGRRGKSTFFHGPS